MTIKGETHVSGEGKAEPASDDKRGRIRTSTTTSSELPRQEQASAAAPQDRLSVVGEQPLTSTVAPRFDNDNDDEEDPILQDKKRHWLESDFAVGLVSPTWKDDRMYFDRAQNKWQVPTFWCSAIVCGCIGAKRVGNMAVCCSTTEKYQHITYSDEEDGHGNRTILSSEQRTRPKLLWMVGPYWFVNMCVTFPLILGLSFWVGWSRIPGNPVWVIIFWGICTFLLIFSLLMISCRNPGILVRHRQKPAGSEGERWLWNDQSKSYRPPKARYDPECACVFDGFGKQSTLRYMRLLLWCWLTFAIDLLITSSCFLPSTFYLPFSLLFVRSHVSMDRDGYYSKEHALVSLVCYDGPSLYYLARCTDEVCVAHLCWERMQLNLSKA